MAVRVFCSNPSELLSRIKAGIRDGSIETWQLDSDGDLTHSPPQWQNQAWFRPITQSDRIVFNILGQTENVMSKVDYAVFHGRLIEMLLSHFDEDFSRVTATAMPVEGDYVGE